jgi:hypothetical protein
LRALLSKKEIGYERGFSFAVLGWINVCYTLLRQRSRAAKVFVGDRQLILQILNLIPIFADFRMIFASMELPELLRFKRFKRLVERLTAQQRSQPSSTVTQTTLIIWRSAENFFFPLFPSFSILSHLSLAFFNSFTLYY